MDKSGLGYFNPRSPRGERHYSYHVDTPTFFISIHAPREGSDCLISPGVLGRQPFQSTLPARGATYFCDHLRAPFPFQSTLPARGATYLFFCFSGCSSDFNPRSPRGERLPPMIHGSINIRISIHAPREGSDDSASSKVFSISISIHAPREGSDQITYFYSRVCRYFNPRSPRGERPWRGNRSHTTN